MKRLFLCLPILFMSCVLFAAPASQQTSSAKPPLSVSFIQTSPQVTLKTIDSKLGIYQLTLQNVNPNTAYFSDRPNRVLGQVTTSKFLETWKKGKGSDSFKNDAPNALLTGVIRSGNQDKPYNLMLVLTNPIYNQSQTQLTYNATILKGKLDSNYNKTITLADGTLIIDSCMSCIGH